MKQCFFFKYLIHRSLTEAYICLKDGSQLQHYRAFLRPEIDSRRQSRSRNAWLYDSECSTPRTFNDTASDSQYLFQEKYSLQRIEVDGTNFADEDSQVFTDEAFHSTFGGMISTDLELRLSFFSF